MKLKHRHFELETVFFTMAMVMIVIMLSVLFYGFSALADTPPPNVIAVKSANITQVGGSNLTLGQKTMANGVPVSIASDQSAIPVSQSGTWTTGRTWTLLNSTDSVNVGNFPAVQPVSGTLTVTGALTDSQLRASPVPVSQSGTWAQNLTQLAGAAFGATNYLPSRITNGTSYVDPTQIRNLSSGSDSVSSVQSGAWTTGRTWSLSSSSDSTAAVQSGTWNIGNLTNITGTISLPTGAATSVLQSTGNSSLSSIDGKITTTANGVKVDGSAVTQPVSAAALPLPSGAATSALQTSGNSTLSTISGQLPATLGAKTIANSLAVNIASDQTVPISAAALPLPSGAATSSLQTTGITALNSIDTKTPALGQALAASSTPVVLPAAQITTLTPLTAVGRTWTLSSSSDYTSAVQSGTWNINNVSGTISLPTGAATSALQTTGNSSLSSIDGKMTSLGQKTMSGSMPVVIASDQSTLTVNSIPLDGNKTTYSAGVAGLVVPATATDIFTIYGSATKTIRITRIEFGFTTTTGSGFGANITLVKRSTANTGGTSSAATVVPHDSTNAAGTASVVSYTANPTSLGTSVGVLRSIRYAVATANATNNIVWDFGDRPAQAPVLRGTSQGLAINLNSVSITGPVADISIEWTEE